MSNLTPDQPLIPEQTANLLKLGLDPDTPTTEAINSPALQAAAHHGYRPVACVGEGGFCDVWCAVNTKTRNLYAVKTIRHGHDESKLSRAISMMRTEADFLRRFNDPRVVRMVDLGGTAETSHLVLEYIPGENIYVHSEMNGINTNQRIEIILGLTEAVALLHRNDVIHGDLKPSNFLIRDDGTPVLIDLGMASDAQQAADPIQVSRFMPGTRRYMAPEQLEGQITRSTFTSDVYALSMTASDLLDADATGMPIPKRVRRLLDRGLSPEPEDRPENACQLLSELQRATKQKPRLLARPVMQIALFLFLTVGVLWISFATAPTAEERLPSASTPNQQPFHAQWHQEASLLHRGDFKSAGDRLLQAPVIDRNWAWRHLQKWATTGMLPATEVQLAPNVTPLARASSEALSAVYLDGHQDLWTVTAEGVRDKVGPVEQTPRSIAITNSGMEIFLVDTDQRLIHYQRHADQWQTEEVRGPGQVSTARLFEMDGQLQLFLTLPDEQAFQVLSRGPGDGAFQASPSIPCDRVLRSGPASYVGVRRRIGENDYVQVWLDGDILQQAALNDGLPPVSFTYDPGNDVLLIGNASGEIWRYSGGECSLFATIPGKRSILDLELHRDEGLLFVASHDVYVFELASGKMLLKLSDQVDEFTLDLTWNETLQQLTAITTTHMRTWDGLADAPSR